MVSAEPHSLCKHSAKQMNGPDPTLSLWGLAHFLQESWGRQKEVLSRENSVAAAVLALGTPTPP